MEVLKKRYYIYGLYGVWVVLFFVVTAFTSRDYFWFFLYAVIMFPTSNYLMKKRKLEIHKMWEMAEELELSKQQLSELSGIGTIDLEATKYTDNGAYFPSRKIVKETIEKIEKLKNTTNENQ